MTFKPPQIDDPLQANDRTWVNDRVQQVVADCLRRRNRGEQVSDESICLAHPELMPELTEKLRHLRLVEIACDQRRPESVREDHLPAAAAESSHTDNNSSHRLRVRCPHCHQPQEVIVDSSLADIGCASCGSHFSLLGETEPAGQAPAVIGHFRLIERLGVGGFGSVWKAWDDELDRLVAIKVPRRGQLTPQESEHFLREARAAAQLRHPHIVSVHEVGRDGETLYIVSDFVDGVTLADRLASERMTAGEAAELCQILAAALHHAHEQGVIHRDLKPANILLDNQGVPHITDFGLARREAGEITMTLDGQLVGTPGYMSPEQARGDSHLADRRSDVYALGVIFYELLTGELPFRGSASLVTQQILHEEATHPRRLNGNVPRDLETICLKCLEKEPAQRYATALDLADDLTRFRCGEPIHARPVGRIERSWRWCRRRPVVAGLTTATAMLLVVVAALTMWSSHRSQESARAARWQQYLSDMHVAMQAWEEGDVGHAREVLHRHRPVADGEDLRRFEWYYLWQQCQSGYQSTALPQEGRVCAVAVSPDGQWLAVCADSSAYAIDVWHLPTQEKRYSLPHKSGCWFKSVAFSPDNKSLISGDTAGGVRLWSVATGSVIHELSGHSDYLFGVAFSPDGTLVATASGDHTVRLWDPATGAPVHVFDYGDQLISFNQVAFSPDGRLLAAGCDDYTAKLWDVTSKSLIRSFSSHGGYVRSVAFSPDGHTLATGSVDKSVKLWSVASGQLQKTLLGHNGLVRSVAFADDGKRLASGSSDGTIRLWDVETDSQVVSLRGHSGSVHTVAFLPGGQTLVSGGSDGMVRLWPVDNPTDVDVLQGHMDQVWALDMSRDGHTLASADMSGVVKLWDRAQGKLLRTCTTSGRSNSNAVAFSPSGRHLAVGDDAGHVDLWETGASDLVRLTRLERGIISLAWSPDEATLAIGESVHDVILWDIDTAAPRLTLSVHPHRVCSVAFSPDGNTFATRSEDGTLRIWDPRTGQLRHTIEDPAYYFCPTAFSPDGRILASGSADLSVKFWDTRNWTLIRSLKGHADRVKGLAFAPDGRTLVSACDDGQIKLWEVATGEERCTLHGHTGEVEAVRFAPDGLTLVSSGSDRTVRLWRAASPEAADFR